MQLLDHTVAEATSSPNGTIVAMPSYTRDTLRSFLSTAHKSSASRYEAYIARRKAGAPREMFPTQEYAKEWLRLAGVVKYVDGGWLGGVLDVASGRSSGLSAKAGGDGRLERKVGKMAWQVISEEFGDGDIEKNHVYVYHKLLDQLNMGAKGADGHSQPGYVQGFDGLAPEQGSPRCWTAAVAQQCIGLLASTRDFFPEAIGFNMAYESLPYHLLVTTRELRELKINDYYFALHVTIDNADSGHAALARLAVERYLEGVKERDGEEAMQTMWRRVQAGYTLAEGLPTTPSSPKNFEQVKRECDGTLRWKPVPEVAVAPASPIETKVAELMIRKSEAAAKMHCPSRMTIKGQTIEQWLDPATLTMDKSLSFIRGLGEKRPWVKAGDAPGSKLIKELEWGGRMFGAFSRAETELMRLWVNKMGAEIETSESGAYNKFVGHEVSARPTVVSSNGSAMDERLKDILPANKNISASNIISRWNIKTNNTQTLEELISENVTSTPSDMARLLPLWFLSTSLLEQFPLSPTKFATPLGMTVLRLLRAQLGFGALHREEDICAGIDDVKSEYEEGDMVGIWELGEKISEALNQGPVVSLQDIVDRIEDEGIAAACVDLLELRTRPYANQAVLLGLTLGLTKALQGIDSASDLLVQDEDKSTLSRIVEEQKQALLDFVQEDQEEMVTAEWKEDFSKGYLQAVNMVQE
jgi:hypothetical protein